MANSYASRTLAGTNVFASSDCFAKSSVAWRDSFRTSAARLLVGGIAVSPLRRLGPNSAARRFIPGTPKHKESERSPLLMRTRFAHPVTASEARLSRRQGNLCSIQRVRPIFHGPWYARRDDEPGTREVAVYLTSLRMTARPSRPLRKFGVVACRVPFSNLVGSPAHGDPVLSTESTLIWVEVNDHVVQWATIVLPQSRLRHSHGDHHDFIRIHNHPHCRRYW